MNLQRCLPRPWDVAPPTKACGAPVGAGATLPLELREHVLTYLTPSDAVSLSSVDSMWRAACLGPYNVERLFAQLPSGQQMPSANLAPGVDHDAHRAMWSRIRQTTRVQRAYMQRAPRHVLIEGECLPGLIRIPEVNLCGQRAAFSADSRYIVLRRAGEVRNTFKADVGSPTCVPLFEAGMTDTCASFSADGKKALTCNWKSRIVRLWDTQARVAVLNRTIQSLQNEAVQSALLSQDGSTIVLRLANQSIEVLSASDPEKAPHTLMPTLLSYSLIALSANGQHVMVYSRRGDAEVWTISAMQVSLRKITMPQRFCDCATLSQDGRYLVTTHGDDQVNVWDLSRPDSQAQPLSQRLGFINAIVFSPDQSSVALCSEDQASIFALKQPAHPPTHRFEVVGEAKDLSFSPDGNYLAVADARDTTIWCLDQRCASSAPLSSLPSIDGVAFSPDGRYLLQSSADGMLQLWDFLENT